MDRTSHDHSSNVLNSNLWAELDNNLLRDIFQRLTPKELILNVSRVCHSWRSVCWDVLFWKDEETLDLTCLSHIINPSRFYEEPFTLTSKRKISIMEVLNPCASYILSQRCVKTIIFAPDVYLSIFDLSYLYTRLPLIKRVVIPNAFYFKPSIVLWFWKHIEELSIGGVRFCSMFEDMGKSGSFVNNLTTLSLSGASSNYELYGVCDYFRSPAYELDRLISSWLGDYVKATNIDQIATRLHQLKVLSIDNYGVHKDGVRKILCDCKNLTRLNIERCRILCCSPDRKTRGHYMVSKNMISGKIKKKIEGESVRWSIDSKKMLFSLQEVVDHLFESI